MSVDVITFGCRLNTFESEVIRGHAEKYDLQDFCIINTCAVTSESERQARQKIRQLKRINPETKIIVTGCMVQMFFKDLIAMPEIDFLIGNEEKLKEDTYKKIKENNLPRLYISDQNKVKKIDSTFVKKFENKVRAFVQIQNGCNNHCSYCLITKARGNSRSVPVQAVIEQINMLAGNYPEIILTGVNIGAYGVDLEERPNLAMLVRRILNLVPNLQFLGISSLSPADFSDDLLEIIVNEKRILPHLHISIQSGDNDVLLAMNRTDYKSEDCIKIIERIKSKRPQVTIGCDIIAGFPCETEEAFGNTKKLLTKAGIEFVHVFPFSKRPGTPAQVMGGQIDKRVAKSRVRELIDLNLAFLNSAMQKYIGTNVCVIAETPYTGKTVNYFPVISNSEMNVGSINDRKVVAVLDGKLVLG